jgi:hypothetical protein
VTVADGDIPVGIYWSSETWALARSAFVADLDHGGPQSLTEWIRTAIDEHAARTPERRRQLAAAGDAPPAERSRGFSKSHPMPAKTLDAMDAAIRADRAEGRVVSQAEFVREATRASAAATRVRIGRDLPPAPDRLPNRWPTRAPGHRAIAGLSWPCSPAGHCGAATTKPSPKPVTSSDEPNPPHDHEVSQEY